MSVLITSLVSGAATGAGTDNDGPRETTGIGSKELGVIINDADPLSVKVGKYYTSRRRIPGSNVIHVSFKPGQKIMRREDFVRIKARVDAATPGHVQAYVLTWTEPYRVECISVTAAFAGFDEAWSCPRECAPTKMNPYLDSNSRQPYDDFRIRPAMALAGLNFKQVKALIDRGVTSDHTMPRGTGYLVTTNDQPRNVRAEIYPEVVEKLGGIVELRPVRGDFITNKKGVMYYFIGAKQVQALSSLQFLPGAIADHLTSAGGMLTDSFQMSSLRWLEAGATGSYGTVSEPCNFPAKFPHPGIVISRYLRGETLLEAYWKSVAWPSQGIFIGEPLAAPYARRIGAAHR